MKVVVAAFNQERGLLRDYDPSDNIGYSLELRNLDNTKRQGDRWTIDRAIASGGLR